MAQLREKIEKTIKAIAKAEANGKDSTIWQVYLLELIDKLENLKVTVKIGRFGFCTCSESSGLCVGCWRIKQSCDCKEFEVDPQVEMKRQYRARLNRAN